MTAPAAPPALDVDGLTISYSRRDRRVYALSDVSFRVERGETYGLVGESGSGKSTLALALLRHLPRTGRVDGGRILLGGDDLLAASERTLRNWRARRIARPARAGSALNPALRGRHATRGGVPRPPRDDPERSRRGIRPSAHGCGSATPHAFSDGTRTSCPQASSSAS